MSGVYPRHPDPLRFAGGYTLDLYCDRDRPAAHHRPSAQFYGQTFSQCRAKARKQGWIVRDDRTATCPMCARSAPG